MCPMVSGDPERYDSARLTARGPGAGEGCENAGARLAVPEPATVTPFMRRAHAASLPHHFRTGHAGSLVAAGLILAGAQQGPLVFGRRTLWNRRVRDRPPERAANGKAPVEPPLVPARRSSAPAMRPMSSPRGWTRGTPWRERQLGRRPLSNKTR
jgi:hypothetical protein